MNVSNDSDYDRVTTEFAEMYEEYCAESDRLFFEWQHDMFYQKLTELKNKGGN